MPCRPAISSMSLGRAWEHALYTKIAEAAKAGFQGIEIFYEDLDHLASTYGPTNNETLLRAATDVHSWCEDFRIDVICLQPFMFYEGLLDRSEHAKRISKLHLWLQLVKALDTDMILIPSNFGPHETLSADLELIVQDLQEVADLGARQSPPVRFAFENLAWGTHIDTWEQVWAVVQRVDHENFGLCVDSFNILARIWADPTAVGGKLPGADRDLEASMERFAASVDVRKIFFAQITDAERLERPLVEGHPWFVEGQPARMSWSRNARLFPFEEGGVLPVGKVLDVLFRKLGFEGWVSMELFSRTMEQTEGTVPEWHARRGMEGWRRMIEEYQIA